MPVHGHSPLVIQVRSNKGSVLVPIFNLQPTLFPWVLKGTYNVSDLKLAVSAFKFEMSLQWNDLTLHNDKISTALTLPSTIRLSFLQYRQLKQIMSGDFQVYFGI